LGDLGIVGRIILKKLDLTVWSGLIWLMAGPLMGCCEHGN